MSKSTDNRFQDTHAGIGAESNRDMQASLERRRFLISASRAASTAPAVALLLAAGMKPHAARASIYGYGKPKDDSHPSSNSNGQGQGRGQGQGNGNPWS
jgi:hypothetical protein